ncbi:exocyst complex component 8 [Aplysia californica]|uniref:Exocyst complex component 8 n=1 Tax=Aplysia californica TaxID=6500 RepID=A0ABM0KAI2_APLCA|nr:exocyst complex component 8 [Aplysia californica]
MADGLARILSKPKFDAETFIAKLSGDGEDALLDMKANVHMLNDETAKALKQNVYKNYSQFIETAREISILEGEMYQLNHMLNEQKSLMGSMMEMSLVSDRAVVEGPKGEEDQKESPEEETRRNLAFLLERVEGCSNVAEVPGRQLVHDGDLVELDAESHTQLQRVHAFLLNDSLMIATWIPNRRGPMRYRFVGLYELDGLAVVNVRDTGPVKNGFKILMFPESHMYQTDTAKAKRQWLDALEDTKKKKASRDKQKKEAAMRLAEQQLQAALASPGEADMSKSFTDDVEEEPVAMDRDFLQADWLEELPEDLDMYIAQRNFEGAVDQVEKVNEYLTECPKGPALKEFRARIEHRVKQLTDGLMNELQVSPERSLRGGPRAARRAVTQLIRLGRSAQACDLFLRNRSAIIKYNIRQLKFEGATTLYIRCLCGVFFSSLSDTAKEFIKAFPGHHGCFSAFVIWSKQELQSFVSIFRRQVFESKASLSTIADCVQLAKRHCQELSSIGLDLEFSLATLLDTAIQQVVEETRDQITEGIKYRAADDLWRPMNHLSQADCDKYVADIAATGFDIRPYVYDKCFVMLTMNSIQFAKICVTFSDDLLKLYTVELEDFIADSLSSVYKSQVAHIEQSLKSERLNKEHSLILKNAQFLLEVVMARVESFYSDRQVPFPAQLQAINAHFRKLKAMANK